MSWPLLSFIYNQVISPTEVGYFSYLSVTHHHPLAPDINDHSRRLSPVIWGNGGSHCRSKEKNDGESSSHQVIKSSSHQGIKAVTCNPRVSRQSLQFQVEVWRRGSSLPLGRPSPDKATHQTLCRKYQTPVFRLFNGVTKGWHPKEKTGFLGSFFPEGVGSFAIPKTILYIPFNFLYAKTWKFWGGPVFPKVKTGSFRGVPYF